MAVNNISSTEESSLLPMYLTMDSVEKLKVNTTAEIVSLNMSSFDIAYVTVTSLVSLMSIFGCVVIFFVHWSYVELRTTGRTMLLHLTVADFLTALGNLLGVIWFLNVNNLENKGGFCKFHSALTVMSSIASFIWTVVIAWFVFWLLFRKHPTLKQTDPCFRIVLPVICWTTPMVIALTALGMDVLGYDHKLLHASWCWIDPETPNAMAWMLITGKAWEAAACIITVTLYAAAKAMLFKQARLRSSLVSHKDRQMDDANAKLTFVPLVFIVIRIWGTIRFLIGSFAHDYANSSAAGWIVILQGSGDSAQGFANFVMYIFFTTKVRKRLFVGCHCCNSVTSHDNNSHLHSFSRKQEEPAGEEKCRFSEAAQVNSESVPNLWVANPSGVE